MVAGYRLQQLAEPLPAQPTRIVLAPRAAQVVQDVVDDLEALAVGHLRILEKRGGLLLDQRLTVLDEQQHALHGRASLDDDDGAHLLGVPGAEGGALRVLDELQRRAAQRQRRPIIQPERPRLLQILPEQKELARQHQLRIPGPALPHLVKEQLDLGQFVLHAPPRAATRLKCRTTTGRGLTTWSRMGGWQAPPRSASVWPDGRQARARNAIAHPGSHSHPGA